jgi:hypothetical protein
MATVFWDSRGVIHLEVGNPLKAKKKAGFSFIPPGQRSSSHCSFNDGNSTETEVGGPASSTVQSRRSSILF